MLSSWSRDANSVTAGTTMETVSPLHHQDEQTIGHAACPERPGIAGHGKDHAEYHQGGKDHAFQFCFWHMQLSSFSAKKETTRNIPRPSDMGLRDISYRFFYAVICLYYSMKCGRCQVFAERDFWKCSAGYPAFSRNPLHFRRKYAILKTD